MALNLRDYPDYPNRNPGKYIRITERMNIMVSVIRDRRSFSFLEIEQAASRFRFFRTPRSIRWLSCHCKSLGIFQRATRLVVVLYKNTGFCGNFRSWNECGQDLFCHRNKMSASF